MPNRDDLPQMRGIDGLRNSSPLGVEPKGEGINGKSGFSPGAFVRARVTQALAYDLVAEPLS